MKHKKINKKDIKEFIVRNNGFYIKITMNNEDTYSLSNGICLNNGVKSSTITVQYHGQNKLGGQISDRYKDFETLIENYKKIKLKLIKKIFY